VLSLRNSYDLVLPLPGIVSDWNSLLFRRHHKNLSSAATPFAAACARIFSGYQPALDAPHDRNPPKACAPRYRHTTSRDIQAVLALSMNSRSMVQACFRLAGFAPPHLLIRSIPSTTMPGGNALALRRQLEQRVQIEVSEAMRRSLPRLSARRLRSCMTFSLFSGWLQKSGAAICCSALSSLVFQARGVKDTSARPAPARGGEYIRVLTRRRSSANNRYTTLATPFAAGCARIFPGYQPELDEPQYRTAPKACAAD
jgi:hypothetical protein